MAGATERPIQEILADLAREGHTQWSLWTLGEGLYEIETSLPEPPRPPHDASFETWQSWRVSVEEGSIAGLHLAAIVEERLTDIRRLHARVALDIRAQSVNRRWNVWSKDPSRGVWMEIDSDLSEAQALAGVERRMAAARRFGVGDAEYLALPAGRRPHTTTPDARRLASEGHQRESDASEEGQ